MKHNRWYFAILMTAAALLAAILFLPGGALAQDDGTPGSETGDGGKDGATTMWHMEGWDLAQMQAHMAAVQSAMHHGYQEAMDGMMSAAGMRNHAGHGGMMQAMPEHMSGAMDGNGDAVMPMMHGMQGQIHGQMHGMEMGTTDEPVLRGN